MDSRALYAKYLKLEKQAQKRQAMAFSSTEIREAWDKANRVYQQWLKVTGKTQEEIEDE